MNRGACIKQIIDSSIELCAELRYGYFSDKYFTPFIQALSAYREMIRGEKNIEREIAEALFFVEFGFTSALSGDLKLNQEKQALISVAHQEFVPLMMAILNPESDFHPDNR